MQLFSWIASPELPAWTALAALKSQGELGAQLQKCRTRYLRSPVLNCLLKLRAFSWWVEAGVWICSSHVSGRPDYQPAFSFLKGNGFPPGGVGHSVGADTSEQRKAGPGLCLAGAETALAPPRVLLLAQALLDTGEARFWERCRHHRLWAAQHWQGRVFMYTSCRRNIHALRTRLPRLGSWWVRTFEISLRSACAQGSKCQVDT